MRIDYGELKRRIRLVDVLISIGWTSTEGRGDQLRGPCPLPTCRSRETSGTQLINEAGATSGKPSTSETSSAKRWFSVNVAKNVYHCFSCGSRGTVLDFWQAYLRTSLWKSAQSLSSQFESSNSSPTPQEPPNPKPNSNHPAKTVRS